MKQIFGDYYGTEDGRIYSKKKNKFLSTRLNNRGYLLVNLSIDGKCKTFSVHRLIAKVFIDNPKNSTEINHKNGIKTDNNIQNLEWVSPTENHRHAVEHNLFIQARGKQTKHGHFSVDDIKKIRELYENNTSQYKLANLFGVTRSAIQQIVQRKTYVYVE